MSTAVQEAPDLPLWDANPVVSIDGYRVGVSLPGAAPRGTDPRVVLGPLSKQGTAAQFDLRSMEPGEGNGRAATQLTVGGSAALDLTVRHREGRTIYHQSMRTPTIALDEPSLVPPSRGAPCKVTATDGRVSAAQPCPATDGNLSSAVAIPSQGTASTSSGGQTTTTTPRVASVTLELLAPTEVDPSSCANATAIVWWSYRATGRVGPGPAPWRQTASCGIRC